MTYGGVVCQARGYAAQAMSWLTDLIDRIDAKLDRPADQSIINDPRKRRSMRMLDQMREDEQRRETGEAPVIESGKVRGGASEKNARDRWLGR